MPSFGIVVAKYGDDAIKFFGQKTGGVIMNILNGISKGTVVALSLLSVPVCCLIYLFLTRKAIHKLLTLYEEYAFILSEILYQLEWKYFKIKRRLIKLK